MGRPKKVRGVCGEPGCGRIELSGGLCRRHYMEARRRRLSPKRDADTSTWTPEVIVWVAGLLEGRGYFRAKEAGGNIPFVIRLNVTDEEVVRHVHAALGIGHVSGPYGRPKLRQVPLWSWTVSRQQHIKALCERIRPWMLQRRRQQIDKILVNLNHVAS